MTATRRTGRRAGRTTARRSSARRRTTSRRRRQPALPTTIGAALGTLVVTSLLDASWPVRIGLVVLAVLLGIGYLLWRHRAEIGPEAPEAPEATNPTTPATPAGEATNPPGPAAYGPSSPQTQGDPPA